ncbi:hypothetical protein N7528_006242 [Penicillium herquei]|nr:hypothetical protein N7528_006242 [Penicillium herquei]
MACENIRSIVNGSFPSLEDFIDIYKEFHESPELPSKEAKTANAVREHLEDRCFSVQDDIGGNGVVGILHNGPGATVLLRSEMDALPIKEATLLSYASKVEMTDEDGIKKGVMHACAHDMHMTCLLGAAALLTKSRRRWSGTLIVLFQPNSVRLLGAKAMLDYKLFDNIPYPTICLAQHCALAKSGTIAVKSGRVLGFLDSLNVRVHGRGAHGASPQLAVDPIILAASIITKLQTIVAREMDPKVPVVIGCGEFHGGTDVGTIPDHADFKVDVRSFSEDTQKFALDAVKRLIQKECEVYGSHRRASITTTVSNPATDNDGEATGRFIQTLKEYYGERASEVVQEMSPDFVSDDFPLLALHSDDEPIPYIYWNIGSTDPETWYEANKEGKLRELIPLRNPKYVPALEPTLKTGIKALALAALTFLTLK